MLLVIAFVATSALLMLPLLLLSRPSEDDKKLQARFASISAKGTGGLVLNEQGDLLMSASTEPSNGFERLLARLAIAEKFKPLLLQANSDMTLRKLLLRCLLAEAVTTFLAFIFLPVRSVALLAGLAGGYIPILLLQLRRKRRIAAFNKALPDAVEMMSRSLRAGYSLVAAISVVAENAPEPAKSEFAEVFRKQNFGLPLRDALMELLDRVPSQDLRVFITGVLVQKDTGGNLAEILDRIVHVIRERLKIQGEIRTHTAQGRMTGWVLCSLPLVMLVVINFVNPGYSKALTDNPLGRKLLYAGLGLLAIGAFLIRHIVNAVEV